MRHISLRIATLRHAERALLASRSPAFLAVRHAATAPRPDDDGDFFDDHAETETHLPPSAEPGPSRLPSQQTPLADPWMPAWHNDRYLPKAAPAVSPRQASKGQETEWPIVKMPGGGSGATSLQRQAGDQSQRPVHGLRASAGTDNSVTTQAGEDDFFFDGMDASSTQDDQSVMSQDDMSAAMTAIATRQETGVSIDTWDPLDAIRQDSSVEATDELDSLPVNINPYDVPLDPNFPTATAIIRQLFTDHKWLTQQDIYRLGTEGLRPVTEPKIMFSNTGQIQIKRDSTRREIYRERLAESGPAFPSHPFRSMRHLKRVILRGLMENNMIHVARRMRPIVYPHELEAARWNAGMLTRRAEKRAFRAGHSPPPPYEPATHVAEYGWRLGAWLGDEKLSVEPSDAQWDKVERLEIAYWRYRDTKRRTAETRTALKQVQYEERAALEQEHQAEAVQLGIGVDIERETYRQHAFENILDYAKQTGEDVTDWLDELSKDLRHVPQHYLPKHYSNGGAKPMGRSREGWAPESIELRSLHNARRIRPELPVFNRDRSRAIEAGDSDGSNEGGRSWRNNSTYSSGGPGGEERPWRNDSAPSSGGPGGGERPWRNNSTSSSGAFGGRESRPPGARPRWGLTN